MAKYTAQVVHVRYWRGAAKRWTTKWQYSGTWSGLATDLDALRDKVSAICYAPNSSPGTYGGIASISLYNTSNGGAPIAQRVYFQWDATSSWIGYTGAGWGTTRTATPEGGGEICAQLFYPAGLSKTGKPVSYRKYLHAVPGTDPSGPAVNISPSVVTSLQAAANAIPGVFGAQGLAFGDGVRTPGSAVILPYYGAHQMVRGRRRKVLTTRQSNNLFQQAINSLTNSTSSQPGLA